MLQSSFSDLIIIEDRGQVTTRGEEVGDGSGVVGLRFLFNEVKVAAKFAIQNSSVVSLLGTTTMINKHLRDHFGLSFKALVFERRHRSHNTVLSRFPSDSIDTRSITEKAVAKKMQVESAQVQSLRCFTMKVLNLALECGPFPTVMN